MASLAPWPGSWSSYVAAQGSSVNVPASNVEAAWPFMAWPWKSRSTTVVISPPRFREGDRDPPLSGRRVKKIGSHVLNSPHPGREGCKDRGTLTPMVQCSDFALILLFSFLCSSALLLPESLPVSVFNLLLCGADYGWDLGGFQPSSLVPYPTPSCT